MRIARLNQGMRLGLLAMSAAKPAGSQICLIAAISSVLGAIANKVKYGTYGEIR